MKITQAMRDAVFSENGKKAGKIGGPARAAALSPKRRKQIAKKAAQARWGKRTDEK
jgi:hypothetical protein